MTVLAPPEPIRADHVLTSFDCGVPELNGWLVDHALASHRAEMAKTFVAHTSLEVRAYYSLATGSVARDAAPSRVGTGTGHHPIPVVILARLAVDIRDQGAGVGRSMLQNALLRIARAGEEIGIRAVLVHLKDPDLAAFYEGLDFEPSPVDDHQMFLLMKDLRKALS